MNRSVWIVSIIVIIFIFLLLSFRSKDNYTHPVLAYQKKASGYRVPAVSGDAIRPPTVYGPL